MPWTQLSGGGKVPPTPPVGPAPVPPAPVPPAPVPPALVPPASVPPAPAPATPAEPDAFPLSVPPPIESEPQAPSAAETAPNATRYRFLTMEDLSSKTEPRFDRRYGPRGENPTDEFFHACF